MSWKLDSIRIFAQDWKRSGSQIIPRLQPLSGGTITQIFGYETPTRHVTAIVVGISDRDDIIDMTQDGATHTLSGPYGVEGSFYVKTVQASQMQGVCQSLRTDLDPYSPVYNVDIEMYE